MSSKDYSHHDKLAGGHGGESPLAKCQHGVPLQRPCSSCFTEQQQRDQQATFPTGSRVRLHSGADTGTVVRWAEPPHSSCRVLVEWDSGSHGSWHVNELVLLDDDTDHALLINGVVWATYPTRASAEARAAELRASGANATVGRVTA